MAASRRLCQGLGICKTSIIRVRNDRLTLTQHGPHTEHHYGLKGAHSVEF